MCPQWKILAVEELNELREVNRKRKGVQGMHGGHRGNQDSRRRPQAQRCTGSLPSMPQRASLQGEVMRATPEVGVVLGWGKGKHLQFFASWGPLSAGGE